MQHKTFTKTAGIVFLVIALVHLARLIYGWNASINGVGVPVWASVVAVIVAGYLASQGLRLSKK